MHSNLNSVEEETKTDMGLTEKDACTTERDSERDNLMEVERMTYPSFVDFTTPHEEASPQSAQHITDESIIAKRKKKDESLTRLLDCMNFAIPKRMKTRGLFRQTLQDKRCPPHAA